jgi:hypothetical protein
MAGINKTSFARWSRDPIVFIREVLIDPETGRPFETVPGSRAVLARSLYADA